MSYSYQLINQQYFCFKSLSLFTEWNQSLCVLSRFSHVRIFATPWTVACLAPLSMGFSRQEYWNGLLYLPPANLPDPGIKPTAPALQENSLPTETPGKNSQISKKHQNSLKNLSSPSQTFTGNPFSIHLCLKKQIDLCCRIGVYKILKQVPWYFHLLYIFFFQICRLFIVSLRPFIINICLSSSLLFSWECFPFCFSPTFYVVGVRIIMFLYDVDFQKQLIRSEVL